jgi:hypothetical protein
MTSDEARDLLPGRGDIRDELENYGANITDVDAEKFLEYLVSFMASADDLDEDEDDLDDDIDDDLQDDIDADAEADEDSDKGFGTSG